jgi:tetratricopeptide (TPR) repeat protein
MHEDGPRVTLLLQRALAEHQAGRLAQAEAAYRAVLAADPAQPQALHWLGVLYHQTGRTEAAEPLIRRALAVAPDIADAHNNLGKILRDNGRPRDAALSFRNALRLQPNVAGIHHNLGLALLDQEDRAAAEASFRNALRLQRNFVQARIDLGTLLASTQRPAEAEACLRVALRTAPADPRVHNALGLALALQQKHEAALAAFDTAIAHAPGFYLEAQGNKASSLLSLQRTAEAEAVLRDILAVAPQDRTALETIGQLLVASGRAAETEPFVRTLLTLSPDDPDLHFTLGGLMARAERYEDALASLGEALRLRPDYAQALHAKGIIHYDSARFDESLPFVERAAALAPDDPEIVSSLSYAYLLRGDYARGWPLFEARTRKPGNARLAEPVWDGSPTERVVLVHAEQGVGDALQFCRFLPLAAQRAPIVVTAPESCRALFEQFTAVRSLHVGPPLPPYDRHCPMMSLPHVLGVEESAFAACVPYLRADPGAVAEWRERLKDLDGLRIGLAWAGNPKYPADRRRSMTLADLHTLRAVPGVSFVALQKDRAEEIAATGWDALTDASPQLHDFADTAALIEALDLVVAVDTAVAHLAGALGRPVWMLNRADTDWRWQRDREDSPWYPTMRIFRQHMPGDWRGVIVRLQEALTIFRDRKKETPRTTTSLTR